MKAFEFDPQKSASNKAKHGIDFVEAQEIWSGHVAQIVAGFRGGEMRYANFGKIGDKYWTVILTYRLARRRIISAYPSNSLQIECYERSRKAAD